MQQGSVEAYAARDKCLTRGYLGLYELESEKSQRRLPAEPIVVGGIEPLKDMEVS
jgi:hypothetical protein